MARECNNFYIFVFSSLCSSDQGYKFIARRPKYVCMYVLSMFKTCQALLLYIVESGVGTWKYFYNKFFLYTTSNSYANSSLWWCYEGNLVTGYYWEENTEVLRTKRVMMRSLLGLGLGRTLNKTVNKEVGKIGC